MIASDLDHRVFKLLPKPSRKTDPSTKARLSPLVTDFARLCTGALTYRANDCRAKLRHLAQRSNPHVVQTAHYTAQLRLLLGEVQRRTDHRAS